MKTKSPLIRITGFFIALIAFAIASFNSSAETSKQPPGICSVHSLPCDLQPSNSFGGFGVLSTFGLLPERQWEASIPFTGTIYTKQGKPMPKSAMQRLYGLHEQSSNHRQKTC